MYPKVSRLATYRISPRTTMAGPRSFPKAWVSPARPSKAWKRNMAERTIRVTPSRKGKKPGCGSVGPPICKWIAPIVKPIPMARKKIPTTISPDFRMASPQRRVLRPPIS